MPSGSGDVELTADELRAVARFSADCAAEALPLFEASQPGDGRPRAAVEAARAFADGGPRTRLQRVTAVDAHRAAKEATDEAARHAARAAGDAAAAAYLHPLARSTQVGHILGAAANAARALELSAGGDATVGEEALERARRWATPVVVDVLSRYPRGKVGRSGVAQLMARLEAALRTPQRAGLAHAEIVRLYGPWAPRTPRDAAALLGNLPRPWWVSGGWCLEAFTGVSRTHDDCDLGVLRDDLPLLRRHLAGRLDVWAAADGALSPLLPDDRPDADADAVLPPGCDQVWTRRSALHPWEFDILLERGDPETWVYRRDPRVRLPLAEARWEHDGIGYLQPEIQLLYKAKGLREKDQADFAATLPFLDGQRRRWLRDALHTTHPGHPWVSALRALPPA